TARLRAEAGRRIPDVYDEIPYATSDAIQSASDVFRRIDEARREKPTPDLLSRLRSRLPFPLSDATLSLLLRTPADGFYSLRTAAERRGGAAIARGVRGSPSHRAAARG